MVRIAVTGGIACGKSLVGDLMAERGIPICDADVLAREAMAPGQEVFDRVVARFGDQVVSDDGTIDRVELSRRVFSDRGEREALNGIVHPAVKAAWDLWLEQRVAAGDSIAAVVVPLLHEAGYLDGWDAIVVVSSFRARQEARLLDRGLSKHEAAARIDAQMPVREKCLLADYVIDNNSTIEILREQTVRMVEHVLEK